jgi:hypothetical protein
MPKLPGNEEVLRAKFERPFDPSDAKSDTDTDPLKVAVRIAHALEHMAYQLGQINQKLDLIVERDGDDD